MDPLSAIKLGSPEVLSAMQRVPQFPGGGGANPLAELERAGSVGATPGVSRVEGAGNSFSGVLGTMVQEVNAKQAAAGQAVGGVLTGENVSLHQAMIAMEEASVSFQLMVEVRNKLLDSYQELMRMQI